jgi:hypothetical protein
VQAAGSVGGLAAFAGTDAAWVASSGRVCGLGAVACADITVTLCTARAQGFVFQVEGRIVRLCRIDGIETRPMGAGGSQMSSSSVEGSETVASVVSGTLALSSTIEAEATTRYQIEMEIVEL